MGSVVYEKIKPKKGRLDKNSRYNFTNWTDFVDPVFADFLSRLWDIGSLDVFDGNLLDPLFRQARKTELLDALEYINAEFFNYFHDVREFDGVEFLHKRTRTALEVSWRSFRDWIVTCKLATLSCFFHLSLSSFLFNDRIFMYVLMQTVV